MNNAPISGKKLVWVGGILLLCAAASARLFAMFWLHDMEKPGATTQATTQAPTQGDEGK